NYSSSLRYSNTHNSHTRSSSIRSRNLRNNRIHLHKLLHKISRRPPYANCSSQDFSLQRGTISRTPRLTRARWPKCKPIICPAYWLLVRRMVSPWLRAKGSDSWEVWDNRQESQEVALAFQGQCRP